MQHLEHYSHINNKELLEINGGKMELTNRSWYSDFFDGFKNHFK